MTAQVNSFFLNHKKAIYDICAETARISITEYNADFSEYEKCISKSIKKKAIRTCSGYLPSKAF